MKGKKQKDDSDNCCRTCAYHQIGMCIKTLFSTTDNQTCDEYAFKGNYKHQS